MSTTAFNPEFAIAAAPILAHAAAAPKVKAGDVNAVRVGHDRTIGALAKQLQQYPEVETISHSIRTRDGAEITVFQYRLPVVTASSLLTAAFIHVHGGGMISGTAAEFAPVVKDLVVQSGLQAFDVDYRLAPEHKHPSLVEDVYAVLLWLHENAAVFNVDSTRIGIVGESAGAGISAGVTLLARDRNLSPPLAKQILVYPMLDSRTKSVSPPDIEKYLVWSVNSNMTGWESLLGDKADSETLQYASPSHAKDLTRLPSTYIDVGTLDLFRDEDIEYASRLVRSGVEVELHVYPGVPHGFELIAPQITLTRQATANRIRALRSI